MHLTGSSGAAVRGGVRIPRSSPRTCRNDFAKLLRRVDPDAQCGFGFEGVILQPGTMVSGAELWPTHEYPRTPLLLEAAVVPSEEPAARRRMEQLYVLWRLDTDRSGSRWVEIGRARSTSWHWALELRGLAVRALAESRGVIRVRINLSEVQERIAATLDRELNRLDSAERLRVLGILHDQLAWRAAAIGSLAAEKPALFCGEFPGNGAGFGPSREFTENSS